MVASLRMVTAMALLVSMMMASSVAVAATPRIILSSADNKLRQFDVATSTIRDLAACPNCAAQSEGFGDGYAIYFLQYMDKGLLNWLPVVNATDGSVIRTVKVGYSELVNPIYDPISKHIIAAMFGLSNDIVSFNIETGTITAITPFNPQWQAVADCAAYSGISSRLYYSAFVLNPQSREVVLFTVNLAVSPVTSTTIPLTDFFAPIIFYQPRNTSIAPTLIGYHDWTKSNKQSQRRDVDGTFPTAALVMIDPATGNTKDLFYFVAPVIVGSEGAFAIDHTNDNLYTLLYRNGTPARWSLGVIPLADPHIATEWQLTFGETDFIVLYPSLPSAATDGAATNNNMTS